MRIVVTGAAGFIASNLTRRLLSQGDEVLGVDNFFLGKRSFIEPFLQDSRYRFVELDLLDLESTASLLANFNPQRVWHLAANSDISFGTKYTDFDLKGGTIVTYNVLEAMRRCGCNELLFSSSGAVYGEPNVHPTPEDYGQMFPISLYAASKLACEGLISAYAHNFDIQAWIFRFGNIVGPNSTHGIIHDFVIRLLEDASHLDILGDGTQAKPYVYIEDCLDGMMFGHDHSFDKAVNYFNLAVQDRTTVTEIAAWTLDALGTNEDACQTRYSGGSRGWRGDVPYVNLDTTKMMGLGWQPKLTSSNAVRRAIQEIVEQFTSNSNPPVRR